MVSDRKPAKFFLQTPKTPHSSHNIFQNQSNIPTAENRRTAREEDARQRRQVKGVLTDARAQAHEPAPLFKGSRARAKNTESPRAQKTNPTRVKLQHTTLHLHPLARRVLEQEASDAEVSISSLGAQVLYDWALSTIEQQQATSLKAELRQIIREELAAFGHRLIYFLRRIAFSAEHARLLATNVLKILLQSRGRYDEKHFHTLVDTTAKTAKRNILRNTPQSKADLEQFWTAFTAEGTTAEDNTPDQEASA
jgi:hypothetical protein